MESKQIPLSDLVSMGYPGNPKEHDIGAIITSLQTFGFIDPVIVNSRTNRILSGHGRVQALVELGERPDGIDAVGDVWLVPCDFVDLPEEQEGAAVIALNRTVELGGWDTQALAELLASFADDEALLNATGYDADDLDALLAEFAPESDLEDVEPQIDRAEELRQKWGVDTGQMWQLGDHRIICGDCTEAAVVERVMGDERAEMVWTDPPYGVSYGDKLEASNPMGYRVRQIENDNLEPDELEELIRGAFINCANSSVPGASLYSACPASTLLPTAISAFGGSGFDFRWQLVWVKDQLVLSRADYHFKHENILYGWKSDGPHYFTEDRKQVSTFEVDRPKRSEEHPTMKPVELIEMMVKNSSHIRGIILEPFSGSGSTIIACERLGRKCRAVEISPGYVAVAIERWHQVTGKEPVLLDTE